MNAPLNTLVWIDHKEAKVFHFDATDVERTFIRSGHPDQHIHHKANSPDSGHASVDVDFLKRVTRAIAPVSYTHLTLPTKRIV